VGSQLLVFEGLGCGVRDRGIESQRTVGDDHLAACEHHGLGVGITGSDWVQQYGIGELDAAFKIAEKIDRARSMMVSGSPLVHELPGRIGFELRLIVASGLRMLDKLQRVRGDVFRRRPVIAKRDWPGILLHAALG